MCIFPVPHSCQLTCKWTENSRFIDQTSFNTCRMKWETPITFPQHFLNLKNWGHWQDCDFFPFLFYFTCDVLRCHYCKFLKLQSNRFLHKTRNCCLSLQKQCNDEGVHILNCCSTILQRWMLLVWSRRSLIKKETFSEIKTMNTILYNAKTAATYG